MTKGVWLLALSYIFVALGQPAWVPLCGPLAAAGGYALFWVFLDRFVSKSHHFYFACFWFFSVQLIQLSWLTAIKYQGFYIIVVYLLASALLGGQFGLLTRFMLTRNPSKIYSSIAVASLGTLFEWLRLHVLCGFSFNFSGMALTCFLPPMQFASVFGILGLSFLFLLSNSLAFRAYKKQFQLKSLAAWASIALFPYAFGMIILYGKGVVEKEAASLKVMLVQTALSPSEKFPLQRFSHDFVSPYEQWRQIFAYVLPHRGDLDLVVLPESVVPFGIEPSIYSLAHVELAGKSLHIDLTPYFPPLESPFAEYKKGEWFVSNAFWTQTLANCSQSEIIAGFDDSDKVLGEHYNAAFWFQPNTKIFERYEKQVLLPLAEYLPWEFLKTFTKSYGITEFFTPGKQSKLFGEKWKAGVSICIEETIPEIMREARNKGAQIFVNVSNDGWYPNSKLTSQHFFHSRVRAVENGIPLLRACNTGVTGVVDERGKLICSLQSESFFRPAEKGGIYKKIHLHSHFTLYSLWGDAGIVILCLASLIGSLRSRVNDAV